MSEDCELPERTRAALVRMGVHTLIKNLEYYLWSSENEQVYVAKERAFANQKLQESIWWYKEEYKRLESGDEEDE